MVENLVMPIPIFSVVETKLFISAPVPESALDSDPEFGSGYSYYA
jgi:hypothetical protein